MKKYLLTISLIFLLLSSAAWAIDGAMGLSKDAAKIEASYTGGAVGLAYNYGLNQDWTVYGSVFSVGGATGFGGGAKYAVLNEKKGDSISLAPKADLLLGAGGLSLRPGLVISKKINKSITILGDLYAWSVKVGKNTVGSTWIGAGIVYNINLHLQLAALIGVAKVSNLGVIDSDLSVGLGLNYLL